MLLKKRDAKLPSSDADIDKQKVYKRNKLKLIEFLEFLIIIKTDLK